MTSVLQDHDRLLLAACFARTGTAIESYRKWREGTDLAGPISGDVYRLLPQLSLRLQAEQHTDDFTDRLNGVYRRAWYVTHRQLRGTENVIGIAASLGIETILGYGAALVTDAPDDGRGVRPLHFGSLLVPSQDVLRLIDRLCGTGWTRTSRLPESVGHAYFEVISSHRLTHPEGGVLRLNTRLVHGYGGPGFYEVQKAGAAQRVFSRTTVSPSPEHQVLSLCSPSDPLEARSLFARAADVLTVYSTRSVDGDQLLSQARQARISGDVRSVLEAAALAAPELIPGDMLRALSRETPSRIEAFERRAAEGSSVLHRAARILCDYARLRHGADRTTVQVRMPEFIAYRLRLSSPAHIPGMILRRLGGRLTLRRQQNMPIPSPQDAA